MDQGDPEERIAELERQLAQSRAEDVIQEHQTASDGLTAQQVREIIFSNPPIGKRGYNEDQVDAFLDRVEATLQDPAAPGGVTPAEVRDTAFSKPRIGRRGYHEDEVDAFLDLVESELARSTEQRPAVDRGREALQDSAASADPGPRHLRPSDESTAHGILEHALAFAEEFRNGRTRVTWRGRLVLGLVSVGLGFAVHPAYLVVAACLLILAACAWRFRWGD
jgi:DivIVA domain-containing protein